MTVLPNHIFALSLHFRHRRETLGLGRGRLALLAGFKDASRGARRIYNFEERGVIDAYLLNKLMALLEVDQQTVDQLLENDRREGFNRWNRWANEVIRPYVGVTRSGPMPISTQVPVEIIELADAEMFASDFARRMRAPVDLIWSRRLRVQFDAEGTLVDRIDTSDAGWPFVPMICGGLPR